MQRLSQKKQFPNWDDQTSSTICPRSHTAQATDACTHHGQLQPSECTQKAIARPGTTGDSLEPADAALPIHFKLDHAKHLLSHNLHFNNTEHARRGALTALREGRAVVAGHRWPTGCIQSTTSSMINNQKPLARDNQSVSMYSDAFP